MGLPAAFQPLEHFRPDPGLAYRLLPFRFMRWKAGEVLLTNEVGEHHLLAAGDFDRLLQRALPADHPDYLALRAKHVIWDNASLLPLELLATKLRSKKAHLQGFTKLHLFVVTLRCDHSCRYCQVSRVTADRRQFDMSEETGRKAVDLMFHCPSERLKIEFQGGEPLLNFELIRFIVEYAARRNESERRDLEFVVTTNLAPLTDEVLAFMSRHRILLSISLDGPAFLHNANRPRPGQDSHQRLVENLGAARSALGHDRVSAVMTTTERSLLYPREIVDEYVRLGFSSIFLRPISPYGLAVRTGEALRYQMDQFLAFYRAALAYIIELNRQGIPFVETYAQILLTKILTPFSTGYVDLQSPAGTVLGAVAYNYDGRVYASDESRMLAEMGDDSFCLGHVDDGYSVLFGSETARGLAVASVQEAIPGCSDCAFLPFCGTDPVFHHRTQGDVIGHKPTSSFCRKNMTLIRMLLELLHGSDDYTRTLLTSWATGVGITKALADGL
jgi:His-Xaa-Ser system radical SAM maturase HxsB